MYPVTKEKIEAWALANKERARVLGERMFKNREAAKLVALESLGEEEDHITLWAVRNPKDAMMVFIGLLSKIKA